MLQQQIFGDGPRVLFEGGLGDVRYVPGVLSPDVATALFERLLFDVDWRRQHRRMYERDVAVPRLTASYALVGQDGVDVPESVAEALAIVGRTLGVRFNSVGLNLYRDHHDSVAPHNDALDELVPGFPIAVLSLGSTRPMRIRAKHPPRAAMGIDLEAGSLLVMSHASQRNYDHGIPKLAVPVGPRISLAFRTRPTGRVGRVRSLLDAQRDPG